MRQGIGVLAVALALSGCNMTPTKAYEGPSRPLHELSVLKGGGSGEEYGYYSLVEILAVDGASQRKGTYLVSFLPGRHSIELSETERLFAGRRVQYCVLDLESVAGCLYIPAPPSPPADAAAGRDPNWVWAVDTPVYVECGSGGAFQLRARGRCGASPQAVRQGAQ
jgi:hypothetical protein